MSWNIRTGLFAGIGLLATLALIAPGCQKTTAVTASEEHDTGETAQADHVSIAVAAGPRKGGAQMWKENCMRCHNLRNPRERSDREWDIIGHHMRVRANLTAEEHRLIVAFLKSAN